MYFTPGPKPGSNCRLFPDGAQSPALVASPFTGFGNALQFDGVNRFSFSQGVDCGPTSALTVQGVGAAATFTLEAKVKMGATVPAFQFVVGRGTAAAAGGIQPVIEINNGKFVGIVRDSSAAQQTVNTTTTLVANTTYDVAFTYDGTNLRMLVNGAVEGTNVSPGVEAPDTTTHFWIGRRDNGGSGYFFIGIIDSVRLSNTARYTANYTPATSPFTDDANTLGLWVLNVKSGDSTVRGNDFRFFSTAIDGTPAGGGPVADIRPFYAGAFPQLTSATMTGNAGVSAAAKIFQIGPTVGSSTLTTTAVAGTALANGKGWSITPTTDMGATAAVQRLILNGEQFGGFNIQGTSAGVLAGQIGIEFDMYKRTSAGVLTFLGGAGNVVPAAAVSTAFSIGMGSTVAASDVVFAAGDTIFVELYVTIPGQTVTAATVSISGLTSSSGGGIGIPNDSRGIGYKQAQSTSDTAPATEAVLATASKSRAISDSAPAVEAVTRTANAARALTDTAPATDAITRVASHPRATTDTAPATDANTRSFVGARATADTAPATDVVTRQAQHYSSTTDSAPAVDAATRSFGGARATTDTAPATDAATRVASHPRATTDSAPAVDSSTRTFVGARATTDSAPAVDTANRAINAKRPTADSAPAADVITRTFTVARALADNAPATDAVTRATVQARSTTDSAPAVETISRVLNQVRVTSDNIGPSGSGNTTVIVKKGPTYVFDD